MTDTDVEAFLEHFGKKGMKWGVTHKTISRSSQGSGPSGKPGQRSSGGGSGNERSSQGGGSVKKDNSARNKKLLIGGGIAVGVLAAGLAMKKYGGVNAGAALRQFNDGSVSKPRIDIPKQATQSRQQAERAVQKLRSSNQQIARQQGRERTATQRLIRQQQARSQQISRATQSNSDLVSGLMSNTDSALAKALGVSMKDFDNPNFNWNA